MQVHLALSPSLLHLFLSFPLPPIPFFTLFSCALYILSVPFFARSSLLLIFILWVYNGVFSLRPCLLNQMDLLPSLAYFMTFCFLPVHFIRRLFFVFIPYLIWISFPFGRTFRMSVLYFFEAKDTRRKWPA